jgi:hypothetical protein
MLRVFNITAMLEFKRSSSKLNSLGDTRLMPNSSNRGNVGGPTEMDSSSRNEQYSRLLGNVIVTGVPPKTQVCMTREHMSPLGK